MPDTTDLKIDKSFTSHLSPGSSDMALSEAIIVMAHKLGFKVIAEGVETEQQRNLLAAVGCDYAQGYLYSKPLPPEKFELLLEMQHKESATEDMSSIAWNNKFETGIQFMDEEHEQLFDLIGHCIGAAREAAKEQQIQCLNGVSSYLKKHFAHEDKLMLSANDRRFDNHIAQHRHIAEKIGMMVSEFRDDGEAISTQDILHVLFDWFVVHNAGEDRKLAEYIGNTAPQLKSPATS